MNTNYNKMSLNQVEELGVMEESNELDIPKDIQTALKTEINQAYSVTVVNCKKLNVRKTPDVKGEVLVVIREHTELLVEEICGNWAHVYTTSGISGYVKTDYIKP